MGTIELQEAILLIRSHIITYGNAAESIITERICKEIETMWNEPAAQISLHNKHYLVRFEITGAYRPDIDDLEILENTDPRNNYFRIEEFSNINISFVDGLGCNTGYFKRSDLYEGSTTAAHEYGHTLGLKHPDDLDIRGMGTPGIMYPRGTLVDAIYQYNPAAIAGDNTNGGTLHPQYRKVRMQDILDLQLHRLEFRDQKSIVGEFSSVWHPDHKDLA